MARYIVFLLYCLSICLTARGQRRLTNIYDNVQLLNSEVLELKLDIVQRDESLKSDISIAEENIKSTLFEKIVPEYMEVQVRQYIEKHLKSESVERLIERRISQETDALRRGLSQLKRQHHHLSKRFHELTTRKIVQGTGIHKKDNGLGKRVEELEQASEEKDNRIETLETEMFTLKENLTETLQEYNRTCCAKQVALKDEISVPDPPDSDFNEVITQTKSKILLVPFLDDDYHYKELDGNLQMSNLMLMNMSYITAISYDRKSKQFIIARHTPRSIVAYHNASRRTKFFKQGVGSFGVAVDSERQVVFMTTYVPMKTVSRISISGQFFRTIAYLSDYKAPRGLAVDPRHRTLYATTYTKVISMNYDGSNRKVLARTFSALSIDIDLFGHVLFYNDGRRLMKHPLKGESVSVMSEFSNSIFALKYYRNTVFVSSEGSIHSVTDGTQHSLTSNDPRRFYLMCLFPEEYTSCKRHKFTV